MTNIYMEKIAGHYQTLNNYRKDLRREANEIYHDHWEGHIPSRITTKAMNDFRDETYVDEYGEVVTPDLNELVRDRMKTRHIDATIERDYGNNVVREADRIAHNGASWKGAGGMLVGGVGGYAVAARLTRNPLISALVGITGMGLGGYHAGKHALNKGEVKADEYLEGVHNQYLQKAASMDTKKKRKYEGGAALTAATGLLGSGAVHDHKSLVVEKRLDNFRASAFPRVQSVRAKAYEQNESPKKALKAERIRASVSDKYHRNTHRVGNVVDRHAAKATRRYVASSILGSLGVGLLLRNKVMNDKKDQ